MADAPQTVRPIRVFVSSPGDVQEERDVLDEVVTRINRTQGNDQGVRLEIWKWEDAVPQVGPKAQDVIDAQTPGYDIYLGIMAYRFGSPTGRYGSGTEKEFKDAVKEWAWLACTGSMPERVPPEPEDYRESIPDSLRDRLPILVKLREFWEHLPHDAGDRLPLDRFQEALSAWLTKTKPAGLSLPG